MQFGVVDDFKEMEVIEVSLKGLLQVKRKW